MKKLFILLALATAMIATSCEKDETIIPQNPVDETAILGKWRAVFDIHFGPGILHQVRYSYAETECVYNFMDNGELLITGRTATGGVVPYANGQSRNGYYDFTYNPNAETVEIIGDANHELNDTFTCTFGLCLFGDYRETSGLSIGFKDKERKNEIISGYTFFVKVEEK